MKLVAIAGSAFFLGGLSFADEVRLLNGGTINGIVRAQGEEIRIETFAGEVVVAPAQVRVIDREHRSRLEEYYERAERLKESGNARDFLELALWVREQKGSRLVRPNVLEAALRLKSVADLEGVVPWAGGATESLGDDARVFWERVISVDPGHESARRKLGFRLHEGAWLTEEEFQVAQGNVLFEGAWVHPDQRAAVLLERKLKLEEREKRVREREEAAAKAERKIDEKQEDVEEAIAKVRREAEELQRKEDTLRELERELRRYVYCRACDGYFAAASHICSARWKYCSSCGGYFAPGHVCPK